MAKPLKPDLFTFVAEIAVKRGDPIPITCNCGGVITIMPPLQEELIICAKCESRIKLLVLSGDPGYVMGRSPNGEPMLIPVQGSSKEKLQISAYRFGLLVTLYLLFSACLAWHLGTLASKSPSTIGALGWVFCAVQNHVHDPGLSDPLSLPTQISIPAKQRPL